MTDPRRRTILEAIASSDDATTSDRVRALDLLTRLDEREPRRFDFSDELEEMSEDELDERLARAGQPS